MWQNDMEDSPFYSCKACHKPLKLWPEEFLTVSKCTKCSDKIENNGINLHVCFTCPDTHIDQRNHLCNKHMDAQKRVVVVDFKAKKELLPLRRRIFMWRFNPLGNRESDDRPMIK